MFYVDTVCSHIFEMVKLTFIQFRTRHSKVLLLKQALKNFKKFTRKYLFWRLFLREVAGLQHPVTKETSVQLFSYYFYKVFKKNLFWNP